MRLLRFEMKKAAFSSRLGAAVCIFIVGQIIMCLCTQATYNYQAVIYKDAYNMYLEKLGGEASQEKTEELYVEEKEISEGEKLINGLYFRLKNGECTPEEYDEAVEQYKEITERKYVFSQVKSQYEYCLQSPEERFFTNENGWYALLFDVMPDFLLAVAVVFIVGSIFCAEYEADMYSLLICSANGRRRLYSVKLLTSLIYIFLFWALSVFIKFICTALRYGVSDFSYPVQSVRAFSVCEYTLSLFGAFSVSCAAKLLGAALIGSLTAFLAVVVKKSVITVFSGVVFNILPYFLLDEITLLNFFPSLGLLLFSRHLSGVETVVGDGYEYLPVEPKYLVLACALGVMLILTSIVICGGLWSRRWNCER